MTAFRIHALATVVAVALAGAPALADPPEDAVSEPLVVTAPANVDVRTVRVAYARADIAGAGRSALDTRIRRAVGYVCGPIERVLDRKRDRSACRTAAFSSADSQIAAAAAAQRYAGVIVLAARRAD